jgi:hypothetical protein
VRHLWEAEVMYDWLDEICDDVVLAHPLKVKAIAEAKIKTRRSRSPTPSPSTMRLRRCQMPPVERATDTVPGGR